MHTSRCSRVGSAARLALLLLVCWSAAVFGQEDSRWITDEFEITMRTGKSTKQSIVRMLSSGTRVELLELDQEAGYALVRTRGGTEGWVLSRYLLSEPPARVTLPELQKRLAEGDSGLQRLTDENQSLKKENRDLARQIAELQRDGSRLQDELGEIRELSSNVIQIDEQNRQLSQRLAETEQLLQEMRAENQTLASRSNREWFIVGAGVLFIGMAMGLILPRIRWKKKSSWSDF
jgi:SH3 domain protein